MTNELELSKLIAIIAPIIVIQLVLMVIALVLCIKAEETRGPKVMWLLIILLGSLIGSIAYFIFGRKNE